MHVHIVYAHPEARSFSHALLDETRRVLEEDGIGPISAYVGGIAVGSIAARRPT